MVWVASVICYSSLTVVVGGSVVATQNPVEFEGTYPLPESQLDRFLLRIVVGYPDRQSELNVLKSHRDGEPVDTLQPALTCEQVASLQQSVRLVAVEDSINDYLIALMQVERAVGQFTFFVPEEDRAAFSEELEEFARQRQ